MQYFADKLKQYARIKWLTVVLIGSVVSLLFTLKIINLISLLAVLGVVGSTSLVNLWLELSIKKQKNLKLAGHVSLASDIFIISSALYFGGGMENTWLFNPVIIIYGAGYVFSLGVSLIYAAYAFALILTMFILEYFRIIPHFNAYGMPDVYWKYPQYCIDYLAGMFVLYFIGAITSGLFNRLLTQTNEQFKKSLAETCLISWMI